MTKKFYCFQIICFSILYQLQTGLSFPMNPSDFLHRSQSQPQASPDSLVKLRLRDVEERLLRVEIELDKLIRQQIQSPRSPQIGLVRRSHIGGKYAKSPFSSDDRKLDSRGDYFSDIPGFEYSHSLPTSAPPELGMNLKIPPQKEKRNTQNK